MKPISHRIFKNSSYFFAISVLLLFFSSCSGDKKTNPAVNFSENGIALSRKTVQVYADLNKIFENHQYQSEFLKIVNDLSPETYTMKSEPDHSFELQNIYKINAFTSLERVFIAYNLQLDPNISTVSASLREKINASCLALDSLDLNEELLMKNEQIKKHVSSSKFKVEETLFQLTDLYAGFWEEESQQWFQQLTVFHEETEKGIKRIPIGIFNNEKLKTLVDEPYENGAVLANIYKLKLVKENQIKISNIEEEMYTISEAFNLLIANQGELLKRNRNNLKVDELNNRLEMLLSN